MSEKAERYPCGVTKATAANTTHINLTDRQYRSIKKGKTVKVLRKHQWFFICPKSAGVDLKKLARYQWKVALWKKKLNALKRSGV